MSAVERYAKTSLKQKLWQTFAKIELTTQLHK